jgi:FMN-dependent NADH-azoreductase
MYNLGIPSTLKSWIDQVARAGITDVEFVYAEGLNMSDDTRSNALSSAHAELARIAA